MFVSDFMIEFPFLVCFFVFLFVFIFANFFIKLALGSLKEVVAVAVLPNMFKKSKPDFKTEDDLKESLVCKKITAKIATIATIATMMNIPALNFNDFIFDCY